MNRKRVLESLVSVPVDEYALYLEKIQAEAEDFLPCMNHARVEATILRDPTCKEICRIPIPLQVQVLVVELGRLRKELSDLGDMHTSVSYELIEKINFVRSLVYDWLLEEVILFPKKKEVPEGWHPSYLVGGDWHMLVFATNNIAEKKTLQP